MVRLVPHEMRDVSYLPHGSKIDVRENEVFFYRVYPSTRGISALDIDVSGREVDVLAATHQVYYAAYKESKYCNTQVLLLAKEAGTVTVTVTPIFDDGSLGEVQLFEVRVT
jgi:hypothetical protein